jgi:tRNA A-37 threonylcarbamoyl transferase component Bud32
MRTGILAHLDDGNEPMTNPTHDSGTREDRLNNILAAYLEAERTGPAPDRDALLAQYPDLTEDLRSFFRDRDRFVRLAEPLHPSVHPANAETQPPGQEAVVDAKLGKIRYVGDYELLQEIARGGMGVVFKARQVSLNRIVALKMILAGELASVADVTRFRAEAEAAANLDHPNILPIYEVGEHEGQQYFSMKLVEGGSLAAAAGAQRPVASKEAARVVETIARAVHFAHQRGILHRDLKPGNILLSALAAGSRLDECVPYITDFGLAKRIKGDSGLTQSGAIVGTPSYMAPEQARADKVLTTAVDVYALGAILYELLTGRPPFRAESPLDTILQVVEKEPEAPSRLQPRVPRDLETICLKCLCKEPGKRYASAQELAEDLRRFQAGEPIEARPVSTLERAAKWARRNAVVAALTAGVFVVLVAGAAISLWFAGQATDEANAARQAEGDARNAKTDADREAAAARKAEGEAKQRETAEALAKGKAKDETARAEREKTRAEINLNKAEWSVYAGKLLLFQAAFNEYNLPEAFRHLEECQWNLRGWEHAHLRQRFDSSKLTLLGHTDIVYSVAFSPDGKRILTGCWDNTAKVWDTETGTEILALKGNPLHRVLSVAFSPDGKRILTGSTDGTAKVWDADKGIELFSLKGHTAAFSPDGKRIVTGSFDSPAKVWDAEKGTEVLTFKGHLSRLTNVAFSPDGRYILTTSGDDVDSPAKLLSPFPKCLSL